MPPLRIERDLELGRDTKEAEVSPQFLQGILEAQSKLAEKEQKSTYLACCTLFLEQCKKGAPRSWWYIIVVLLLLIALCNYASDSAQYLLGFCCILLITRPTPRIYQPAKPIPKQKITYTRPATTNHIKVSVVIPARNEQQNIAKCMNSLLQVNANNNEVNSSNEFVLGRDWELIVVDDDSSDDTNKIATEIASKYQGVRILRAPILDDTTKQYFTGKNNACWFGALNAFGDYIVFTDADTQHESGNIGRAFTEITERKVSMLSYSPKQIVTGVAQRALMPLVFSELFGMFPIDKVNDPKDQLAAANGQFVMYEREAYFSVGGHFSVGKTVLEDVALAYNVKHSNLPVHFRYAPDALQTSMYSGFYDMVEGWSKNLVLLFPHALTLAAWKMRDLLLFLIPLLSTLTLPLEYWQYVLFLLVWTYSTFDFIRQVQKSHFSLLHCIMSVLALPLYICLLVRSWVNHHYFRSVTWKGRVIQSCGR